MIWAKLTARFVGKPYRAGATGPDAYDCLGLIIRAQRKLGWEMPKEFEGWTLENYAQRFESDPKAGIETLERYLDTHCERVDVRYLRRGDIVIVRQNHNGVRFPGLYAGKRQFLTVITGQKVRIFGADSKLFTILAAWRHGS